MDSLHWQNVHLNDLFSTILNNSFIEQAFCFQPGLQLEELLKRARSLQHEVDEHDDND